MENFRRWRAGAIISGIVLAIVMVLLVIWGFNPQITAGPTVTPTPSPTASVPPATAPPKVDLTVTPEDLAHLITPCVGDEFITDSMPGDQLVWSDSVSKTFTSKDPAKATDEIAYQNCHNLTVLDQNIRGLVDLPVSKTETFRQVNAWWVDEYFTVVDAAKGNLRTAFLTKKDSHGDSIFVTADFQKFAELTNIALARVKVVGLFEQLSKTNWHVPERMGMTAGEIPRVELNPNQERRLAFWYEYTLKDNSCTGGVGFGFNYFDMRFETRTTSCVVTPPPSSGCTGTCKPPECPPSECLTPKDSSKDPSHHGTDGGNGGPNQNSGLDEKTDKPVVSSDPHVDPSPPAPTSPPVGSTPAPSPTATPPAEGGGLN